MMMMLGFRLMKTVRVQKYLYNSNNNNNLREFFIERFLRS
jgi:hypothetical protein